MKYLLLPLILWETDAAQEPFGHITLPLQCQRHGCNGKTGPTAFAMVILKEPLVIWGKVGFQTAPPYIPTWLLI